MSYIRNDHYLALISFISSEMSFTICLKTRCYPNLISFSIPRYENIIFFDQVYFFFLEESAVSISLALKKIGERVKHNHRRETHAFGVKPPVKGNQIRLETSKRRERVSDSPGCARHRSHCPSCMHRRPESSPAGGKVQGWPLQQFEQEASMATLRVHFHSKSHQCQGVLGGRQVGQFCTRCIWEHQEHCGIHDTPKPSRS